MICFSFYCSDWVISATLFYASMIHSSVSADLQLIPYTVFFISVIVFFSSDFSALFKFSLCWSFHCIPLFCLWVRWVFFGSWHWTSYLVDYLPPFHLGFFVWGFVLFFWNIFLSLHTLPSCVSFYILVRSVMFPCFEGVALCKGCPLGPPSSPEASTPGVSPLRGSLICVWATIGVNLLIFSTVFLCGFEAQ